MYSARAFAFPNHAIHSPDPATYSSALAPASIDHSLWSMVSDIGIHALLLLLSVAGILFATCTGWSDPVLRGRLIGPSRRPGSFKLLLAVTGRRTLRVRVQPSGHFRLTLPCGGRAMITIVQHRQVLRTLRLSHHMAAAVHPKPLRQVFVIGDIRMQAGEQERFRMQLFCLRGSDVVITTGTGPVRHVPFEHQLLDHSGQALDRVYGRPANG